MHNDDLPPRRRPPEIPGFIWLVVGLVLVLGFVLVIRILHPSSIGVSPSPPVVAPAPPKGD